MKKLLVFVAVILCAFSVGAQALKTTYFFEADYMPTGALASFTKDMTYFDQDGVEYTFVNPSLTAFDGSFRFLFDVDFLLWDHFFFGGQLGTVFTMASDTIYGLKGTPTFMSSLFRIGGRFGPVEIGLERFCNHPVIPNAYAQFITSLDGEVSWGKIYVRVSGKF